jgi:hypothetical protein
VDVACEGLEDERKWMTDTESAFGAYIFYRYFARKLHTAETYGSG